MVKLAMSCMWRICRWLELALQHCSSGILTRENGVSVDTVIQINPWVANPK